MASYAVIENGTVINVIVAESKEIAEQISGKECVEQTHENPLSLDWYWSEQHSKYIPPALFPSWVYDGTTWVAPVEMPVEEGKFFTWDETSVSWIANDMPSEEGIFDDDGEEKTAEELGHEKPFEQWVWNENQWLPPFPKPDDGQEYVWSESLANWQLK
jgi:hypothetical protein